MTIRVYPKKKILLTLFSLNTEDAEFTELLLYRTRRLAEASKVLHRALRRSQLCEEA